MEKVVSIVRRGGFSLVEIIIAITVLAVISIPLALIATEYIRAASSGDSLVTALNLARREIAVANSLNFSSVTSLTTNNYLGYNYDVQRTVAAIGSSGGLKRVIVKVFPNGSTTAIAQLVAYISNVKFTPADGLREKILTRDLRNSFTIPGWPGSYTFPGGAAFGTINGYMKMEWTGKVKGEADISILYKNLTAPVGMDPYILIEVYYPAWGSCAAKLYQCYCRGNGSYGVMFTFKLRRIASPSTPGVKFTKYTPVEVTGLTVLYQESPVVVSPEQEGWVHITVANGATVDIAGLNIQTR